MSVKLKIYNDIEAKLNELAFIKKVLHYNGQELNDFEQEQAWGFPQAWIQLTDVSWNEEELLANNTNITREQKTESVSITIHYAYFSLEDDSESFKQVLTDVDLIYRALVDLKGDYYTSLQRVSESDQPTNNNVKVWAQEYTTMLTECGVVKGSEDISPIEIDINKEVDSFRLTYQDILSNEKVYNNNITILANGN